MNKRHPYVGIPDYQLWKNELGNIDYSLFDPVTNPSFTIDSDEPVVTAGSCFAQHVSKALIEAGFNSLVTEKAHPMIPESLANQHSFHMFSARYGNVYTARQLLQLLLRAYGQMEPQDVAWEAPARLPGRVVCPFRPQVQPGGFASVNELLRDRAQHFAAVRRAIDGMKVFIFTLGLTECFEDRRDGAVFPIAPGIAGGRWNDDVYGFRNFNATETTEDLLSALEFIRARNPSVKIILTVSPVPLNATYCSRHVAVSTAWSKAVLRVAAQNVIERIERCDYFPSYEIITSPQTAGHYFGEDRREVLGAGVRHVMELFLRHYGKKVVEADGSAQHEVFSDKRPQKNDVEKMIQIFCDEEAIDNK